jgi:hypothetical protein
MAAPKDKISGCALERPRQAWTMLGWGAGPREGSLSHEACLKNKAPPRLLASGFPDWPEGDSQAQAPICSGFHCGVSFLPHFLGTVLWWE